MTHPSYKERKASEVVEIKHGLDTNVAIDQLTDTQWIQLRLDCIELIEASLTYGIDPHTLIAFFTFEPVVAVPTTVSKNDKQAIEALGLDLAKHLVETKQVTTAHNLIENTTSIYPPREYMKMAMLSRDIPVTFNPKEIEELSNTTVIVLGASTGTPIAQALSWYTEVYVGDPDTFGRSNLPRLGGTIKARRIGQNKAEALQEEILLVNEFAEVTALPESVDPEQLAELIDKLKLEGKNVVLVDAMDNLKLKIDVRTVAKNLGVTVWMHTNAAGISVIQHERPTDEYFGKYASAEAALERLSTLNPVAGIVEIVGSYNLAPEQMLNFILMASGVQPSIAQDLFGSVEGGTRTAELILQKQLGRRVEGTVVIDRTSGIYGFDTKTSLGMNYKQVTDRRLLEYMREEQSEIFAKYIRKIENGEITALQIIQAELKDRFGIDYNWREPLSTGYGF